MKGWAGCTTGCIFIALVLAVATILSVGVLDLGTGSVAASGWTKPVAGAVISQRFGCTTFGAEPYDAACPGKHFHSGVDLAIRAGTPVYAADAGTARVVSSTTGFGLHVIIDHGDGLVSLYGHLSTVIVATGEAVEAGRQIGTVGSTGNSTGPHLHFEIDRDGIPEDPLTDLVLP